MESLERKDASTGPEEPIKSEDVVPSSNASDRSNNAASPPPNCSICLGKLINMSFTDSCLHQFCFSCLLQWSKIKTECPLCKQTFKSIIHNVRSQEDYDQYHVQRTSQVAATLDVTADIHISGQWDIHTLARPFFYRTTMGAPAHRRYGMLLNPEAVARREQIPSMAPQVSGEERRRRHANPIDYRRTVYRHGVWAASLPDAFGRFRESSADFYRRHPSEVNRLIPWLNRELQVLLNNNRPHIAYVMSVITGILTQCDIRSDEFRNTVRQYFGIHTDHFVHELSNYARTNFDLVGYDQAVNYIPSRGLSNEYVHRAVSPTLSTSSSSSNDSDVYVLADSNDRISYMPHMNDAPGPSTVGQVFRVPLPPLTPDVLTISSTSSASENECEVIGYVKPRHERTPEIINLSSSDGENRLASNTTSNNNTQAEALLPLKEENLPSTSSSGDANRANSRTRRRTDDSAAAQMYNYLDSTSESNSGENDSDYNPKSRKSRRHKISGSKKSSKVAPRKLRSRKRKKSATTQQKRDKETRSRSYFSSCDESDNESPQRGASSCRGKKRYLSKSSDASGTDKVSKKKKKSKKSTSSTKTKKRKATSSSISKKAPAPMYEYSSSYSSNLCDDSEPENSKSSFNSRRRTSKASTTTTFHDYTSAEELSDNEKSSSKSSVAQSSWQENKANDKFGDSDFSDYRRSESSRRSSSGSCDSRKVADRLQNIEDNSRHCTSEDAMGSSCDSTYSDNESTNLDPERKLNGSKSTVTTTTISGQTISQSSEISSATASSSNSSSKSDASSPAEHSSPSKSSRDRHRSHKKRNESKKRRRSRS